MGAHTRFGITITPHNSALPIDNVPERVHHRNHEQLCLTDLTERCSLSCLLAVAKPKILTYAGRAAR
jgi:hypothetical protein